MKRRTGIWAFDMRRSFGRILSGLPLSLVVLLCYGPGAAAQCPVEMAKLLALDGTPQAFVAADVAISGDTVVIGSDQAGVGGTAYVFYRNEGGANRWGQVARLEPAGVAAHDHFGGSVTIDGDTIAVGAPNRASGSGAVYVFERDLGGVDNWGERTTLVASSATPFATLGISVAISQDTIAAGAPDEGTIYVGSVWVFERDLGGPDNWGEAAKLLQSDGDIGVGYFGGNVTIQDGTIVSGAYGAYNQGLECGAAYVFERDAGGPGAWGEVQRLVASDFAENDFFGGDVSLSETTLAISSRSTGGAVYVFEHSTAWSERLKIATGGDAGVALDGDTLLAARGTDPGAVYTFHRDLGGSDNWGIAGEYLASDGYVGNQFGREVAIDGDTHVIGARGDDHQVQASASAYVYDPTPLACPESYCTAGVTSGGCGATLSTRGLPGASSTSGFDLVARGVPGQRTGLFFYGARARRAIPWGDPLNGCTSTLCIAAPLYRCAVRSSGGTLGECDGTFTYDLTVQWTNSATQNPVIGMTVQAQLWFRDVNNACNGPVPVGTTALSDAIEFVVGP